MTNKKITKKVISKLADSKKYERILDYIINSFDDDTDPEESLKDLGLNMEPDFSKLQKLYTEYWADMKKDRMAAEKILMEKIKKTW